jgi:excisionase family DNA binding protein
VTSGVGGGAFELKALYTVPELAAMIGMHPRTLRRWLERKEVPLLRVGESISVPLVAFREAFPEVWASLRAVGGLSRDIACPVCGESVHQ